jgi:flagellar biosynthetic protein FliS
MYPQQTELSYRRSALAGATSIGLVIALYDTLSGNLRRAATAIRNNNIEQRCSELNHGLLVLGQLESMIDTKSKDEVGNSLTLFYGYLRNRMLMASLEKSATMLEEQIGLILQVRSAWQQRDQVATPAVPTALLGGEVPAFGERTALSLSM